MHHQPPIPTTHVLVLKQLCTPKEERRRLLPSKSLPSIQEIKNLCEYNSALSRRDGRLIEGSSLLYHRGLVLVKGAYTARLFVLLAERHCAERRAGSTRSMGREVETRCVRGVQRGRKGSAPWAVVLVWQRRAMEGAEAWLPVRVCVCVSRSQKLQLTPLPRPGAPLAPRPAPVCLPVPPPRSLARSPGPEELLRPPLYSCHYLARSFIRG